MDVPEGCPLKKRQFEAARLTSLGLSQTRVAEQMGLSVSTVGTHLMHARRCLGVATSMQLVIAMRDSGWLDPQLSEWDDSAPLSPAQQLYVDAFMAYLRARTPVQSARALLVKAHMLTAMFLEAGIRQPEGTGQLINFSEFVRPRDTDGPRRPRQTHKQGSKP